MMSEFDRHFMSMALREAEKAAADGEVPTGCVIVEPAPLEGGKEAKQGKTEQHEKHGILLRLQKHINEIRAKAECKFQDHLPRGSCGVVLIKLPCQQMPGFFDKRALLICIDPAVDQG